MDFNRRDCMTKYIAIIGDLIDSRLIPNRHQVQKELQSVMDKLNKKYQGELVSNFTITTGDEFQALLEINAPFLKIVDDINVSFRDHKIRYGIGVGTILTEINPEQSIGADGEAYWQARKAIDMIHERNDYGTVHLAIGLSDEILEKRLNGTLAMTEFIRNNWVETQAQILGRLLENNIYHESFEHQLIAQQLGLNSSAFSKRLKSSGVKIYLRVRNQIMEEIKVVNGEDNG